MAAVSSVEVTGGRGGEWTLNGVEIMRTKKRRFLVSTESREDDEEDVLRHSGIPKLGHAITINGTEIVLTSKGASPVGDNFPTLWYAECQYEPREGDEDESDEQDDPTTKPAEVSYTTEFIDEVVWGSFTLDSMAGDPQWDVVYKNSAGEPFDPPLTDQIPLLVMTVSQYDTNFDPVHMTLAAGTVNSDVWQGAAMRTVKLRSAQATKEWIQHKAYWKMTAEFAWKAVTWDRFILDAGTFYLDDDGDKQSFLTKDNVPFVGLLDGVGGELDAGVEPKVLRFEEKRILPFAQFNLRI